MKVKFEVQHNGFDISYDKIIELVKESLKNKKIPVTKVNVNIYYVPETQIIYYETEYQGNVVKGEVYA